MSSSALSRTQRVIPQWLGTPLGVLVWGTATALLFVLLLFVLYVLTTLLVTKGDVPIGVLDRFEPTPHWARGFDREQAAPLRRMGLLPLVAQAPNGQLAQWYHRWGVLRHSETCMWTLLAVTLLVGSLGCVTLFLFKRAVTKSAEQAATELRDRIRVQAYQLDASDPPQRLVLLFRDTVETVRQGLIAKWELIPNTVLLLGMLAALAMWIHVWVALSALFMACLVGMAVSTLRESALRQEARLADQATQEMSALTASMREIRHVRGLLLDDTPGEGFDVLLARYHKAAQRFHARLCSHRPWMMLLLLSGGIFLTGLVGVNMLRQPAQITFAEAALAVAALGCCVIPVRNLFELRQKLPKVNAAAAEIFAYLDRQPSLHDAADAAPLIAPGQQIRLQDVSLRDAVGKPSLQQLSLSIPAGKRVVVLATNPTEAHSLGLLLARFRDPDVGDVFFDDQNLRGVTLESLRKQTSLVLQEGMIFAGTVSDNVGCGDERFTATQIAEALKLAQANDFIPSLPQGLATPIGYQGTRLEATQALRIGLARVLLRNPSVVVVEEPAVEMDEDSARALDAALDAIAQHRTLIMIPSRLSTLQNAACVYLLHDGALAGSGTHAGLIHENELYRHQIFLKFHSKMPPAVKRPAPTPPTVPPPHTAHSIQPPPSTRAPS